jgi:hypothetical protein
MNDRMLAALKDELVARGFESDGSAPNDTMTLDYAYLSEVEVGDLLETMVARREKVFRSVVVVGAEASKKSFDDVVLAIEAIKAMLSRLVLP